ncbi:MAG: biopolymer transporter ExbD [Deltaproteobacteria bacterium]|nr:biopolymer transporter ExbD [Deltaproteobacteria bacterium]
MTNSSSNGQRGNLAEINITPLCDVLLVLLIIFMVTAPLLTQGIDVNLPQTKAKDVERTKNDIILTLRQTGEEYQIFIGDSTKPVGVASLEQHLKNVFEERDEKDLFLRADRDIRYGEVAKVMAIAKLAGIRRIGMMTQPEEP